MASQVCVPLRWEKGGYCGPETDACEHVSSSNAPHPPGSLASANIQTSTQGSIGAVSLLSLSKSGWSLFGPHYRAFQGNSGHVGEVRLSTGWGSTKALGGTCGENAPRGAGHGMPSVPLGFNPLIRNFNLIKLQSRHLFFGTQTVGPQPLAPSSASLSFLYFSIQPISPPPPPPGYHPLFYPLCTSGGKGRGSTGSHYAEGHGKFFGEMVEKFSTEHGRTWRLWIL